jgi:hypothetical protein
VGNAIHVQNLDKVQPNYNSWVGTSIGLFTEHQSADFDWFICKDGFSKLPTVGMSNFYGVEKINQKSVTNTSENGGWLMISGVDLGIQKKNAKGIEIQYNAKTDGVVELWVDDLKTGKLVAKIPYSASKNSVRKSLKSIAGHHDIFVKFPVGKSHDLQINSLQFLP